MTYPIDILPAIQSALDNHLPHLRVASASFLAEGLDGHVFRAASTQLGDVAIKVPKRRRVSNDLEDKIDAFDQLLQEGTVSRLFENSDVPVHRVFGAYLDEETDFGFIVSEYIEHDGSPPAWVEVGEIVRAIHEIRPPRGRRVAQTEPTLELTLAHLLDMRFRAVERIFGVRLAMPPKAEMTDMLRWPGRERLLHMDIRPANILTLNGVIQAVVDWSNALMGDPALELTRIDECGYLTHDFLSGYGAPGDWPDRMPRSVEILYRLYTATLLAVVFHDVKGAGDEHRAFARVIALCAAFKT
ncbi:MAG: aminoglycoside phosphotransferase family protein [SAR202 cluster bacterium]|nr:aminoglycoside phosphotransferase family protein [SAR202 cluster bacterium]